MAATTPIKSQRWHRIWLLVAIAAFVTVAGTLAMSVDSDSDAVGLRLDRSQQAEADRLTGLAEYFSAAEQRVYGSADALAHRAEATQQRSPIYGSADALAQRAESSDQGPIYGSADSLEHHAES